MRQAFILSRVAAGAAALHPHAALRGERGGNGRDDGHDEVEEGLPFLFGHGCRVLGISCCRRRRLVTVAVGTILAYQRP